MKFIWFLLFLFVLTFLRIVLYEGQNFHDGQKVILEGYISESPKISSGRQIFRFKGLRVKTELLPRYSYGDKIKLEGTVTKKAFESDGKVIEYLEVEDLHISQSESVNSFIRVIASIRKKITSNILNSLPSPESDLLIGIILGDDSGFDKKTSDTFSKSGLLHIVAASGTNITIVGGLFYYGFFHLFGRRRSLLVSIVAIFLYAFLAGFSPSIQRAVLMGGIGYLGLFLGKQTYAFLSLILVGFGLVLINPYIVSDIGFQLSFAATAGILIIQPVIQQASFFNRNTFTKEISVTLSAYLALIPILLYHFHTFTPFSVVVNCFILWSIPVITVVGGIGALTSLLLYPLGTIIFWVVYPILHYIIVVAEFFSNLLPEFEFGSSVPIYIILGYYSILSSFIFKYRK